MFDKRIEMGYGLIVPNNPITTTNINNLIPPKSGELK
ncbi:MAG: hypothetical protein ACJA1B_001432 [Polaribacter sp.]|jgi:hypothetical protein